MDEIPSDIPAPSPRRRSGSETRKRTRSINVRVTAQEAARLAGAADAAGLPVAGYLRSVALRKRAPRVVRLPLIERRDLAQVLGLLGRVGGNVNQVAKAFNTNATTPEAAELTAIRTDIRVMHDALMEALAPSA